MSRDYLENTNTEVTPKTTTTIEGQFNQLSNSISELCNLWKDLEKRLMGVLTPMEVAPEGEKRVAEDPRPNMSPLANDLSNIHHTIDKLRTDMNKTLCRIEL